MAYIVHGAKSQGWYAAFDRTPSWHLSQTINIAPDKIANYLLHSVSQNTSVENDG